ncbi:MAG: hypothetical protein L0214_15890, partial [candidate division NC10 bacterium]|nr:hypothetical protein [candidate division NC10 bacterium]
MALCALAVPQTGASDYLGGGQATDSNEVLNPEVLIVFNNFDPPQELIRVPIVKATTLVPEGAGGGNPTAELQFKLTRANPDTLEAALGKLALSIVDRTLESARVVGIPID